MFNDSIGESLSDDLRQVNATYNRIGKFNNTPGTYSVLRESTQFGM
jgi:hypothetical protein